MRRTLRHDAARLPRISKAALGAAAADEAAVSYATAAVDSTTLRFGATHPWGATPGVEAEARAAAAPVSSTASGTSTSGAAAPWASSPSTRSTSACTTAAPV